MATQSEEKIHKIINIFESPLIVEAPKSVVKEKIRRGATALDLWTGEPLTGEALASWQKLQQARIEAQKKRLLTRAKSIKTN